MSKTYVYKVTGEINEKISSSSSTGGIDSFYIGDVEHKITSLEYQPDANYYGIPLPVLVIHYDDGEIYIPATETYKELIYLFYPVG